MNFLSSPGLSLACAIFNAAFAAISFSDGSIAWAVLGVILSGVCFNNYLRRR